MNPQDPLAALKPLREPGAIDWWPPAPGWWILAALTVLLIAATAYALYKYWHRNAYRRQALQQLTALQAQHTATGNDARYATELNALLKSTALVAYPRKDVAAQHGEQWRQFLNQGLAPDDQFQSEFFAAAYVSETLSLDKARLQRSAQRWIKKHRVAR